MAEECDICGGSADDYPVEEVSRMRGNNYDIVREERSCKCRAVGCLVQFNDYKGDYDELSDNGSPSRWGT